LLLAFRDPADVPIGSSRIEVFSTRLRQEAVHASRVSIPGQLLTFDYLYFTFPLAIITHKNPLLSPENPRIHFQGTT